MLIFFLAGLVFFLYGRLIFEKSLQRTNQFRLQCLFKLLAKHRITALILGSLFAIGTQSSTVAVTTLVSMVNAGLLQLSQAIGMVLGASIGTTLMLQMIAFNLANYGLWLVVLGFLISRLRKSSWFYGGELIVGIGLMFYGISLMGNGLEALQQTAQGEIFLRNICSNTFLTLIIAFFITLICQTTLAPLAIGIALIREGDLTLLAALPIILGSHIGASVLPLLTTRGRGDKSVAYRLAIANLIYRLLGSLMFLMILVPWANSTIAVTDIITSGRAEISRYLANAHTLFTLISVILFLIFLKPFSRFLIKLFPGKKGPPAGLVYLVPGLTNWQEVEAAAQKEIAHLAEQVCQLLKRTKELWEGDNFNEITGVDIDCKSIIIHQEAITHYLTKIPRADIGQEYFPREIRIIELAANLREVSDIIRDNFINVLKKRIRNGLSFSIEGLHEISSIHDSLIAEAESLIAVLCGKQDFASVALVKKEVNSSVRKSYEVHIERRHRGIWETEETSSLHFSALMVLEHIHYHLQKALNQIK